MYPFLILSSLSVGFYVVLLVALHRDDRRHRTRITLTHPMLFSGRSGIRLARSNGDVTVSGHFPDTSSEVSWRPVTRMQWKPAGPAIQANQSNQVIVAPPINAGTRVNCG